MFQATKKGVFLFFLALSCGAFCQVNQKGPINVQRGDNSGYSISGLIKGVDSGSVRLLSPNGDKVLDSSVVSGGKFFLRGKVGTPQRLLFNIAPGNWNFRAFVEDSRIKLSIDTAGAEHYGSGKDGWALIWRIEERGSELADVYTAYEKETEQPYYSAAFSSLRSRRKAIQGDTAAAAKVAEEMDSVRNVALARQKTWIENYIDRHPSSIASVYLFYEYYPSSPDKSLSYLESVLSQFSGNATSSPYFKELFQRVVRLNNTQAGKLAPEFSLLKRDSSRFTLSSTRGSYVLIDFWASWCVPCRKAIPAWKEVYAAYKDKGFVIVSISNDRKWSDWTKALEKEGMPWVQVIDEFPAPGAGARVAELYEANVFPFYVLLDKEGKVVFCSGEESIMRKKIEELLR